MVSIKTVLTLGAIGVGLFAFFGLGGFKGVGSKIGSGLGSGFTDFGKSFISGFGNPFAQTASADTGGDTMAPTGGAGGGPSALDKTLTAIDPLRNQISNLNNFAKLFQNLLGGGNFPKRGRRYNDP